MATEFGKIFAALASAKVQYLVVGGVAVVMHGHTRLTADLADSATRESWIEDKGLMVLSLWSPSFSLTEVDLFVREPFPFADTFARAVSMVIEGTSIPVASIDDLIALKKAAARPKDLEDIRELERIKAEKQA